MASEDTTAACGCGHPRTAPIAGPDSGHVFATAEEVAAYLRISESQVYRLHRQPGFPKALSVGARALRWRWSDIVAWTETGGLNPVPEPAGGLGTPKRRGPQRRG